MTPNAPVSEWFRVYRKEILITNNLGSPPLVIKNPTLFEVVLWSEILWIWSGRGKRSEAQKKAGYWTMIS